MFAVAKNSWALLLGILLLMIGNGIQGTALGLRGGIEGFSASTMAWVMSAYFLGFLGGSRLAPMFIARVGHVRVFAALGSMISAAFILYAAVPEPWAWAVMRLLVGFCFSGVYVVAESWLNDSSTNETRGQSLSLYMVVQLTGIVIAQGVVNFADPGGYTLFVIMSVLVSVAFAPILLSVSPVPAFSTTKRLSLVDLFKLSPLAVVSSFLLGFVFAAMFGMGAVYGTEKGLSVLSITIFVATFYIGGMICQFPLGMLSDRMDRRRLILILSLLGTASCIVGWPFLGFSVVAIVLAFVIGGLANPLYSIVIAHAADYLGADDMAAASSGLIFVNGVGAIFGPFVVGWMMTTFGPDAYFLFFAIIFASMAGYAAWRATRREAAESSSDWVAVSPSGTTVAAQSAYSAAEETDAEPA